MQYKMNMLAVISTLALLLINSVTEGAAIGDVDLARIFRNVQDNKDEILYRDLDSRAAKILVNRGLVSDYLASWAKDVCAKGVDWVNKNIGRRQDAAVDNENLESRAVEILMNRSVLSDILASLGKDICNEGIEWLKNKLGRKRDVAVDDEQKND